MVLDKIPNTQLFTQRDVRETSGTGSTPSIADFTNSQHDHSNTVGGGTIAHSATTGKTANDHHNESHTIASHSDTSVTGAELTAAESASHTQGTDTALGSGAVAADHGTASTDQIVNVSYGTGAEPAANTTTEGSIYIKYTA